MTRSVLHPVPGVPNDAWTITERTTSSGARFFPKLNGRHLMRRNGKSAEIAWYSSMDDATQAVHDFLGRMA